jgi:pimeloyl-ACP methyl ester carboxylesterase
MDALTQKTFTTSRSLSYNYYTTNSSSSPATPTLLLIHGWPDSAHLWTSIVPSLLQTKYPLLVLDTLGSGASSKPTSVPAYNWRDMTTDLAELLASESITSSITIGHDWGSALAQHLYLYHPSLVAGLVLLNVAYMPPGPDPFSLEASNAMVMKMFGYPAGAYWEVQLAADAPELMQRNAGRLWEAMHGAKAGLLKEVFCTFGALRKYLEGGSGRVELKPYAQDEALKEEFLERFAEKEAISAQLNWYRAVAENVQFETDRELPKERHVVKVPVLYIGCTEDAVCRTDLNQYPRGLGLLPDYKEVVLECGHWSPMEKPAEIAEAVKGFLGEKF